METQTLHVQGMSCNHCVKAVEENVGQLDGVASVTVHLKDAKVDVEFDQEKAPLTKIMETIEDQGYDVTK
ncbi:copper chaperone CopZ [Alkalihalobacillus sp. NPDC078783]